MIKKMLALVAGILISHGAIAESRENFEIWLNREMLHYSVPGVSLALIRDYKVVWIQGFGMADLAAARPVSPSTLFQAGSLSKPVTAMAALNAVQEGKISLDTDIHQWLSSWKIPSSPCKNKKITFRQLLGHGAGMNVSGFFGYAKGAPLPGLVDVLKGKSPANSEPVRVVSCKKKAFLYSGGGYTIIQQALMDVYHASFADLMQQQILAPLQMKESTFEQPLPARFRKNIALPYRPHGKPLPGGPHTYIEGAAAGLWTTANDLAKFLISIQRSLKGDSNQILNRQNARLMTSIPESREKDVIMGLGMMESLDRYGKFQPSGSWFGHAGQNEGYRNFFLANTRDGNGLVILTNMSEPIGHANSDKDWDFIMALVKKIADLEGWKQDFM